MELIIYFKGSPITVLYDECDHELISAHKWRGNRDGYAVRSKKQKDKNLTIIMHRLILGVTDPKIEIDHINHNKSDNRRCNLRQCNHQQNATNRKKLVGSKSKYLGVTIKYNRTKSGKLNGPYIKAEMRINGRVTHLGYFATEEQAAMAYNRAAKTHHGEFANLNLIDPKKVEQIEQSYGVINVE